MPKQSPSPTVENSAAIVLAMVALGFGVGLAWPQLANRIMVAAPPAEAEAAAGAIMTVQLIATTMSAAAGGFLIETTTRTPDTDMATPAAWLFGLLVLAPITAGVLWPGDNAESGPGKMRPSTR